MYEYIYLHNIAISSEPAFVWAVDLNTSNQYYQNYAAMLMSYSLSMRLLCRNNLGNNRL